jgi:hypothetical protein
MYIPFSILYFIENIIDFYKKIEMIILIVSLFIEIIMILVFIETIEINCCGLNKNLKKNIRSRATSESSLTIENDEEDDDEIND